MNEKLDLVPDKLNEQPTAFLGLTQKEMIMLASKCIGGGAIVGLFLGLTTGVVMLVSMFLGLGIAGGSGLTFFLAKYIIAPRKAGTPYGYKDQKSKVNGLFVKIGMRKLRTIHVTKLWRHKK